MAKRLAAALSSLLESLAAGALLILMLVVFVDVAGRSFFNRPLPWGTELLEVVLGAMIFSIYPLLAFRSNHITVDLITVGRSVRRVQRVVASLVGCAVFLIITWSVGRQAIRSVEYGDASALLQIPTGAVLWCMCALSSAAAVAFLLALRRPPEAEPAPIHPLLD
jgi:TRAP-type transport system small permease protein